MKKTFAFILALSLLLTMSACHEKETTSSGDVSESVSDHETAGSAAAETDGETGGSEPGNTADSGESGASKGKTNSSAKSTGGRPGNTTAKKTTASSKSKKITLTFSFWGQGDEKKAVEKALADFSKKNNHITIKTNHIPVDYLTKLTAMAAGNTLPDLGYFTESAVLQWAKNGKILDLSALFADKSRIADKLDMVKFVTADGKTVAASVANEVACLFYNKDIFDEAKLPYPPSKASEAWTWDQFVDVAKKLTRDRKGNNAASAAFDSKNVATYGVCLPMSNLLFEPLMWSNGGGILSQDNKKILLDSAESVEALQAMQDLMFVHKVAPNASVQATMPVMSTALATRTVAMQLGMQYELMSLSEAQKTEGLHYGVGVLPKFKEPVSINGGSPIVVFSSTTHPEEAKSLLVHLMNPDNMLPLINNGLWMPNEKEWYKSDARISKWVKNDVHTTDYRSAVIDYTNTCVRQNMYYRYDKTTELINTIWPAIEKVYLGTDSAKNAVNSVMPKLKRLVG